MNPELLKVPCAVVQYNKFQGGGIIALSYEAKARGVRRSMRGNDARVVCPDIRLVTVPTANEKADLTRYRNAGSSVFEVCARHSDLCERTSIDEAYLDITLQARTLLSNMDEFKRRLRLSGVMIGTESNLADSDEFEKEIFWKDSLQPENNDTQDSLLAAGSVIVAEIRAAVKDKTGYTLSAGISHNKMLSKLVSGKNKPNKQTVLSSTKVEKLLSRLPLRDLNGFGGKLGDKLIDKCSIKYVGDLKKYSLMKLAKMAIGSEIVRINSATWMSQACRGICTETVKSRIAAKSISCGKTFRGPTRLRSIDNVKEYIDKLSIELAERLQNAKQKHRQVAKLITVSYHTGSKTVKRKGQEINLTGNISKSRSCRCPATPNAVNISKAVMQVLEKELDSECIRAGVTCLYIGASKLENVRDEATGIDTLLKKVVSASTATSESDSHLYIQKPKQAAKRRTGIEQMFTRPLTPYEPNKKPNRSLQAATRVSNDGGDIQQKEETKPTIHNLFFRAKSKSTKSNSSIRIQNQLTWNQVDQTVFRELPSELQKEVMSSIRSEMPQQATRRKRFKWSQKP